MSKLQGIIPPLVTPLDASGDIDGEALRKEIAYHLQFEIGGLCFTGSTGDGQMLTIEQSREVAEIAVQVIGGQVPIIGGIIRDSTADVIRYGKELVKAGVDYLQVTPVHYLFQPDEEATVKYYDRISDATDSELLIYNVIPYALIPATTVARVMDEIPGVVGVKQSGGNIHQLADLLRMNLSSGAVFTAVDDLLYPAYLLGAQGAISATLTVVPGLCVDQWNAVKEGRHDEALRIHNALLPIWRSIDGPNMTARIKEALSMQGRYGGLPAEPLSAVTDVERRSIRLALEQADLI